jgi:hypothetical protein
VIFVILIPIFNGNLCRTHSCEVVFCYSKFHYINENALKFPFSSTHRQRKMNKSKTKTKKTKKSSSDDAILVDV